MGVATRSRRLFEGDTVVPLKKLAATRPKWTVAGKRAHVLFARPAQETEMFVTLPLDSATAAALSTEHQVHVLAWDPVTKCAYDRGAFTVARLHKSQVVLQKVWSSPKQKRGAANTHVQRACRADGVTTRAMTKSGQAGAKSCGATTPTTTTLAEKNGERRPCATATTTMQRDAANTPLQRVCRAATVASDAITESGDGATTMRPEVVSKNSTQGEQPDAANTPAHPAQPMILRTRVHTLATASTATTWNTRVFARPVTPSNSNTPTNNFMVRAIPTLFHGVQYRSRLEAKFARLLQLLNIRFVYEPMRHVKSGGGTYTIDFFLPEQQLYVELKPKRPHLEEEQRCEDMSAQGFRVALMYGSALYKPPFRSELWQGRSHRDYAHHDALRGMCWVDGVKLVGETVFVANAAPPTSSTPHDVLSVSHADKPHLHQVVSPRDMRWAHPAILRAYQQLREEGSSLFT